MGADSVAVVEIGEKKAHGTRQKVQGTRKKVMESG
jgi:hypothetical protein